MKRLGHAQWQGSFKEGKGVMKFADFEGNYSTPSRFENGTGTNPEELIGAAHAGCFSMAFSLELGNAGYTPDSVDTTAEVTLEKKGDGFAITSVHLKTKAKVPGIDEQTFQKIAEGAKEGCPVSQALAGTSISLDAELI